MSDILLLDTTDWGNSVFRCNIQGATVSVTGGSFSNSTGGKVPLAVSDANYFVPNILAATSPNQPSGSGFIIDHTATTSNGGNAMVNAAYLNGYTVQTTPPLATLIARTLPSTTPSPTILPLLILVRMANWRR